MGSVSFLNTIVPQHAPSTRNILTFVNTTAIACHQIPEALIVSWLAADLGTGDGDGDRQFVLVWRFVMFYFYLFLFFVFV